MNPALPLLLLGCLIPWLVRRREATTAWALIGLLALALLLPALLIPDGIPSPSVTLERLAPWHGALALESGADLPPPGGLDDITFQVEPWLLFLRQEVRAWRFPFWNPHQSAGTPYWANGSSAPLFPLHILFSLLPAQIGFVLLPWLRLVLGGLGAWWLARELGVESRAALLAGILYPLSGRFVAFLLYPMANAFCLVPWIFLATERLATGRQPGQRFSGTFLLAALAGLQLMAGHPETAVMTALLCAVYLLVRVRWRSGGSGERSAWGVWGRFTVAWSVAGALSAVQTLPLAAYLFASTRWAAWHAADPMTLPLAGRLALRFFLPNAWGHPASADFWGPFNFVSTSIYLGALAVPLALTGALLERRDRRWLAVVAMTLFALLAAFRLPPVEPLLLALPVLKKALHHYFAFGFGLGVALLAAVGLERYLRGRSGGATVPVLAGAILTAAALASGWLVWSSEWAARGQTKAQVLATVVTGGFVLLLALGLRMPSHWRRRLAPLLLTLAALDLWAAHLRANPALSIARLYPKTPALEELKRQSGRVAAPGFALRPNAAMVYGLYDVRGDDSLKLANYERLYGEELGTPHPTFFRPLENWESRWLDLLGVRWVLAPPGAAPRASGWRLHHDGHDARLFERPSALPLVRWEGAATGSELTVVQREAGRWEIDWSTPRPARVLIAETFAPGWRAQLQDRPGDRRPVEVRAVDDVLMAVDLEAGEGTLLLRYRPPGIRWGIALSLLGLLTLPWLGRLESAA